jgi:hypothetical protein
MEMAIPLNAMANIVYQKTRPYLTWAGAPFFTTNATTPLSNPIPPASMCRVRIGVIEFSSVSVSAVYANKKSLNTS